MDEERYQEMLQIVADKEGVPAEQVERELQQVLDEVYDALDEQAQQGWSDLEFQGQRPSVKAYIESVLRKRRI